VHQVRDARDRLCRDFERRDQLRIRLGRRRNRDRVAVVDVVEEADRDAPFGSPADRSADDRGRLGLEVEVVVREVERSPGRRDELCDPAGDLPGALPAVVESPDL
jgi:hypothetical protein